MRGVDIDSRRHYLLCIAAVTIVEEVERRRLPQRRHQPPWWHIRTRSPRPSRRREDATAHTQLPSIRGPTLRVEDGFTEKFEHREAIFARQ
ncbi:hypothetical protein GCM10009776_37340 [Microbacterium deminutum]|uniref:Uncharacterized protein n=1 Tax=Microbacterium deminutum TaxID=344164 RepID=A0ABP5CYN6_9MICO